MTVVYLDSVFLFNALLDYLLFLSTARLAGIPLRRRRYLLCGVLGGLYAAAVFLPGGGFLTETLVKAGVGLLLALIACVLYFVILLVYASSAEVRAETVAAGIRWLPSPAVMYEQAGLMRLLFMGEAPTLLAAFMEFLALFASVNVGLAVFNLIPLPPLDGSKILGSLLPPQTAARYLRIEYYTRFVFLGIVLVSWLSPTLSDILFWPLEFLRSGILNLYQALMLLLF